MSSVFFSASITQSSFAASETPSTTSELYDRRRATFTAGVAERPFVRAATRLAFPVCICFFADVVVVEPDPEGCTFNKLKERDTVGDAGPVRAPAARGTDGQLGRRL